MIQVLEKSETNVTLVVSHDVYNKIRIMFPDHGNKKNDNVVLSPLDDNKLSPQQLVAKQKVMNTKKEELYNI